MVEVNGQTRLKDVAAALGLSVAVVSKVLNRSRGTAAVAPATIVRIRAAAERMGYACNRTAAALRAGAQRTIGLLFHPMGAPGGELTQELLEGMATELTRHDRRLDLAFYHGPEEFADQMRRMGPGRVDGLIVSGVGHAYVGPALVELARTGLPVATILADPADKRIPNVGCSDVDGGRLATAHLLAQGCRRIAIIGMWEQRLRGYRRALAAHGLPADAALIHRTGREEITARDGEAGVAALVGRGAAFDGLVCQCDLYALGALHALARLGRTVPNEVKVIGFDDAPFCEHLAVPLSSVSMALRERARRAVRLMLRLQAGEAVGSETVSPRLIPRASSLASPTQP